MSGLRYFWFTLVLGACLVGCGKSAPLEKAANSESPGG